MKDNYQKSMTNTVNRLNMLIILLVVSLSGFSQNVGINASGVAPNSNAGLDVNFTDKGMLIPRVALTSTSSFAPLSAHVAGMLVYNTATTGDVVPGFYYNTGSAWTTGFPAAQSTGSILYWDGTSWAGVPTGSPGQYLQLSGGLTPYWSGFSTMATIFTATASAITDVTATSGGNITNNGGSAINTRGVCWSTVPGPTIENSHTTNGSGTGTFTSALTGLTQGTTYYIRAYAINTSSVSYGNEYHFTTTTPTIPILSATDAASAITSATAVSGGNLTSNGNAVITARGICYSTTNPPTIADTKVVDAGTAIGTFTSNLSGLTSNTLYYIRSYATNGAGTGYGPVVSFTSQAIVTTTAITSVTTTGATSGGTLTVGGNASITERGVCWSTSANPTTADAKTSDGTTTGTFVSTITGLAYTTLYHVRAYATNGGGTVYGDDITFTTLTPTAPVLAATTAASAITGATATSGGDVTSDGGAPITERGLVWATAQNPTTAAAGKVFVSNPDPGTGIFTGNLSGLTGGTTYYVRAYATNSVGTAYGTQVSFITIKTRPTLTTDAATNITGVAATTGGSAVLNGAGYSYGNRGIAYSTTPNASSPTLISNGFNTSFPATPWSTNLSGLTANTTYYIRSYLDTYDSSVSPSWVTVYGNELSFITSAATAPVVASTTVASLITGSTVRTGGAITSDGGSAITAKGVCWGVSPNPTIGVGNFSTDGTGSTVFVSNLTGLSGSTIYYVRAYATNSIGTTYGPADVTFTTSTASLYTVGQNLGYGWVAYVNPSTGGGFIVSSDIELSGAGWGCSGTSIATATALGTGKANTTLILANCATRPIAASLAADYTGGGFSDWYLPSSGEWSYIQSTASYNMINSSGYNDYYTSSQSNATSANTVWVTGGGYLGSQTGSKAGDTYAYRIRAIRDFGGLAAVAPTVLSTTAISAPTLTGGSTGGYISSDGGATVTARGVCYGTTTNPDITGTKTTDGTGMGTFTSALTGLTTGATYFIRAYATNSAGTSYGPEIIFSLVPAGFPSVTTTAVTNVAATTATTGGNVIGDGGGTVTARGICYSTTTTPTIADVTVVDPGTGTGAFVSNISGLTTGQIYYVRAYATNGAGTSYGAEYNFTPYTFATLTTDVVTAIQATTATSGGNISSDGGSVVTTRGVCWSTVTNPTISDSTTSDGTGSGTFISSITGLTNGVTYYVKAYATNEAGTAYGTEESFIASGLGTPTVTTTPIVISSGIETTILVDGEVVSDGGAPVTARGFVYSSTSFPPTILDPHTTDGTGTGPFTGSISGLQAGNFYTIIAYATNSYGTAYGAETYYMPVGLPTVETGILAYTPGDVIAQSYVTVTNDGGDAVTASGIVWGTSPNPTIVSNTGITIAGAYPSQIMTGIQQNITYYFRAYATNGVGTAYGNELSFTPGVLAVPQLVTGTVYNKVGSIAEVGGSILSDSGDPIIEGGLVWSTTIDPDIITNKDGLTANWFGLGSYTEFINGLTVGTTYHVRAYATNATGTGYGQDISFVATAATIGQVISSPYSSGANVFSVDGTGLHGLMAYPYEYLPADWGCTSSTIGTTGTAIGTGLNNTTDIINDIATNGCSSAFSGAPNYFDFAAPMATWFGPDWYLPSKDELTLLKTNSVAAGVDMSMATYPIWSSSEDDATHAWSFDGTNWVSSLKTAQNMVWVIRSF